MYVCKKCGGFNDFAFEDGAGEVQIIERVIEVPKEVVMARLILE